MIAACFQLASVSLVGRVKFLGGGDVSDDSID
jgi:hypothetical protein